MPELILATVPHAGGLIAGVLGAAAGVLVVVIVAEAIADEPVKPRVIPIRTWVALWVPLGLILIFTDMPGWLRTLLFVIPLALTVGVFNRRAA